MPSPALPLPSAQQSSTCDIYRPFGAASPAATGVVCRHVPVIGGTGPLVWTDYLDLDVGVDVRDGCTRAAGADAITYADGDEVRIPDVGGSRYVVVWVEVLNRGTARAFKRAYQLRHSAAWPGP